MADNPSARIAAATAAADPQAAVIAALQQEITALRAAQAGPAPTRDPQLTALDRLIADHIHARQNDIAELRSLEGRLDHAVAGGGYTDHVAALMDALQDGAADVNAAITKFFDARGVVIPVEPPPEPH